jgi:hypothetical protein
VDRRDDDEKYLLPLKCKGADMNQPQYSLLQISQWGAKESEVKLPNVQRGFVWKPSQVENLWDSLLRGYPIGSFVLSKKKESEKRELLDGQQRATAICLGFGMETFRQSQQKARIFVDLERPKNGNRKYLFRVITRSHPWGYQSADNTKTLESAKINEARQLYGLKDHLKAESLDSFFPYDALFPVPLDLFLRASSYEELVTLVEDWELWDQVHDRWQAKVEQLQKKSEGSCLPLASRQDLNKSLAAIYRDVEKILDPEQGVKIPALYLDLSAVLESADSAEPQQQQELEELAEEDEPVSDAEMERTADEIETIFIRLNAGGTPLRGEELNYSILKAHIGGDLQKRIESACSSLMSPARFITFAYRLNSSADGSATPDGYSMKIKPRQFQKAIRGKKDIERFTAFLEGILADRSYEGETLLDYLKKVLLYHETENPIGLPYPTMSRLAGSAPEVIFLLLYRMKVSGDRFGEPELRRAMLGVVTLFAWFGKGEKLKDHAKLLGKIWPAAQKLDGGRFWSWATVQRAKLEGTLLPIPRLEELAKVKKCVLKRTSEIWPTFEREAGTTSFVRKAFNNRDILLYAQRDALALWFQEEMFELDDTNVPFDWDHIFPHTLVRNKKKIPQILKSSYNTNGNFRAWPYALNRSDQDALPKVKLNPDSTDQQFLTLLKTCRSYLEARGESLKGEDLPGTLRRWSACGTSWTGSIKDVKTEFKKVYSMIVDRNVELCGKWYQELGIEELLPAAAEELSFETLLNKKKWRKMPEQFPRWLSEDGELSLVCGPHQVGKHSLYLYLVYPECSEQDDSLELLEAEAIRFGIVEVASDGLLKTVNIDQQKHRNYKLEEGVLWGTFTLVHHSDDAYRELLSGFHCWLKQCPEKKLRVMESFFMESLKKGALGG